ncbi:MAG: hypothetical protein MJ097_02385 [Dorea sp.]|nr:hypothetical protein [Dorea sp.]
MVYRECLEWRDYYLEIDEKKRGKLLEELLTSLPDDGANELRKKLYDSRYHDPKKPGKKVDRGIWEMVVMPSYLSGFIVSKERIKKYIDVSLTNLGINDEVRNDEVLSSAVYWEIRNIARRFYKTCESPQYGRKFFGITESSWEEKQVRCGHDVWIMAEVVAEKFDKKEDMKIFSDAVVDEFFLMSDQAEEIYRDIQRKMKVPRFQIILG